MKVSDSQPVAVSAPEFPSPEDHSHAKVLCVARLLRQSPETFRNLSVAKLPWKTADYKAIMFTQPPRASTPVCDRVVPVGVFLFHTTRRIKKFQAWFPHVFAVVGDISAIGVTWR